MARINGPGWKTKRFSLAYHATKTIHHHHHHHHHHCLIFKINFQSLSLYNLLTLESINAEEFHFTHHLHNISFSIFYLLCNLMSVLKVKSKHLLLHYVVRAKHAVFKSCCKQSFILTVLFFIYFFQSMIVINETISFIFVFAKKRVHCEQFQTNFQGFFNHFITGQTFTSTFQPFRPN